MKRSRGPMFAALWILSLAMLAFQEGDPQIKGCNNDGKTMAGEDRKCKCWNACVKDHEWPNEYDRIHGDRRCSTYCRRETCQCKAPCD